MTITLPPDLAAALSERAAHSNLTAEEYVLRVIYNLCEPFDLATEPNRRLAELAAPYRSGIPNWAIRADEDDAR